MIKIGTILPFLLIMNLAGCSDNALHLSESELCSKAKDNPESLISDMTSSMHVDGMKYHIVELCLSNEMLLQV